jgi:hypothetical protein
VNSGRPQGTETQSRSTSSSDRNSGFDNAESRTIPTQRLAPTQRVSEVCEIGFPTYDKLTLGVGQGNFRLR